MHRFSAQPSQRNMVLGFGVEVILLQLAAVAYVVRALQPIQFDEIVCRTVLFLLPFQCRK